MAYQRSPGLMVLSLVLPYLSPIHASPVAGSAFPTGSAPTASDFVNSTLLDLTSLSTHPHAFAPPLHTGSGSNLFSLFGRVSRVSLRPAIALRGVYARNIGGDVPIQYTELRQTFIPGYIVLSYIVAVVGSLCTLELLLRRTSNRGTYNVLLLIAAGICFGAVSTFSMHFIGNNSLRLHHPHEAELNYAPLSLSYSAGYTILSLVVSCTAMTMAFFVMGLEVDWRGVVRRTGLHRMKRRGSDVSEMDGTGDEDDEEGKGGGALSKGTDLSQEVKKKELKDVRDQMKRLERKTKLNDVMQKLEWALGWSMVTVPKNLAGDTKAEKMQLELRKAEEKAKKLEGEIGGMDLVDAKTREEIVSGERELEVVETVASDPVASGYDNPVSEPQMVPVAQVAQRDLEDLSAGQALGYQAEDAEHKSGHDTGPTDRSSVALRTPPPTTTHVFTPPSAGQSMFSPDFSFPASSPPNGGTKHTFFDPFSTPDNSFGLVSPHRYPPPTSAIPSHLSPSSNRRASMPSALLHGSSISPFNSPLSRDFARPSFSLARISSLPDQDQDEVAVSRPSVVDEEQVEEEERKIVDEVMASARTRASEKGDLGDDRTSVPDFRPASQDAKTPQHFGTDSVSSSMAALHPVDPHADLEKGTQRRAGSHGLRVRRHRERRKTSAKRYSKWESWLGLDVVTRGDILKVVTTGTIAGAGVAGMHYIGQRSITTYPYIAYSAGMVVASVVIACVSVTVGLYILFIMLRPKLKHGWGVKIGVACILGAAVCFMHYCGMGGTTYAMRVSDQPTSEKHLNRSGNRAITGAVAALALLACIAILSFTVIQQMRQLAHRRQRRKIVIATMIYDQDDRLLVAPDGVVPLIDIESVISNRQAIRNAMSRKHNKSGWDSESTSSSILDVDLTTSHPAFVSAIRSTWAWRQPGVLPAVQLSDPSSGISEVYTADSASQFSEPNTPVSRRQSMLSTAESALYPGFPGQMPLAQNVGKFLDRFSVAVSTLARDVIGSPTAIRRLGVLYDRILTTGHVSIGNDPDATHKSRKVTVAKGQLLFLVRRVTTQHEQSQLVARNYLFAEQSAVANVMSKVLAVPVGDFLDIMHDQTDFCDFGMTTSVKPGRLYGGLCVIQPTTSDGIRIVVERQRRHQLPMREVCGITSTPSALRSQGTQGTERSLTGWSATVEELGEAARALSGQTLFDMIAAHNEDYSSPSPADDLSVRLRDALVEALIPMLDMTFPSKAMARVLPRLTVTPTLVPLFVPLPSTNPKYASHARMAPELAQSSHTAWIIMFKAILAVDTDCSNLDLEPWSLFRAQSECILRDGRESAAAMRAAALAAASANVYNGLIPPEVNRGRRPSKVQWMNLGPASRPTTPMTPPSHGTNQGMRDITDAAGATVPLASQSSLNEKVRSPWSEKMGSPSIFPSNEVPWSDALTRPITSAPSTLPNENPRANRPLRDLAITIPKTAMRTTAHQPLSDGEGEGFPLDLPPSSSGFGREVAPGVSFYHPDWLTRILREEMLPKASEEYEHGQS